MGNEQILEKIEENRIRMSTIQRLVEDLYWEYDRMSSSGQQTLYKLASLVFKNSKSFIILILQKFQSTSQMSMP